MKIKIFGLLAISILLLWVASMYAPRFVPVAPSVGDLVFSGTEEVDKIVLNVRDTAMIFVKDQGIWRFENGYYVNGLFVDGFLQALQKSVYLPTIANNPKTYYHKLTLYSHGKYLFDFELSEKYADNRSNIIVDGLEYTISERLYVPAHKYQWYRQPLIRMDNVESAENIDIEQLEPFWPCLDVIEESQINKDSKKNFSINFANGVILNGVLYKDNDDYWVALKLSVDVIVTKETAVFVKNNTPLYEGWVFKLTSEQGRKLFGN